MRRLALLLAPLALASAAAQPADSLVAPAAAVVVEAAAGVAFLTPDGGGAVGPVAPGVAVAVPPGVPVAVVLVSRTDVWDAPRASASVTVAAGDTARVALVLPRRVRVETVPLGAVVAFEGADGTRRELGTAPLAADLPAGAAGVLVARREGYADARQPLPPGGEAVTLVLAPTDPLAALPVAERLPTARSTRGRLAIDLAVAAATLAAGAVAVYYKFEADAVDDRYRSPLSASRGDEALRQEALRLDRTSAVALGAMQVGVGVLALRFVLR